MRQKSVGYTLRSLIMKHQWEVDRRKGVWLHVTFLLFSDRTWAHFKGREETDVELLTPRIRKQTAFNMEGVCSALVGSLVFCLLGRKAAELEDLSGMDQPIQHGGEGRGRASPEIQTGDQVRAQFLVRVPRDDRRLQPGQSRSFWNITSQGPLCIKGHPQVLRGGQRGGHSGSCGHWRRPGSKKTSRSSSGPGEPRLPALHQALSHQHDSLLWQAGLSLSRVGGASLRVTEEAQRPTRTKSGSYLTLLHASVCSSAEWV